MTYVLTEANSPVTSGFHDPFLPVTAEERAAVAAAEGQLAAYNARDVEAFCAWFHDDVQIATVGDPTPGPNGIAKFREVYGAAFAREPDVRCAVIHRHVVGKFVTDYELLTGFKDGSEKRAVAIYETRAGRIARVWFVR